MDFTENQHKMGRKRAKKNKTEASAGASGQSQPPKSEGTNKKPANKQDNRPSGQSSQTNQANKQGRNEKQDEAPKKCVITVSMRNMMTLDDPNNGRYCQDKWTTIAAPDWVERGLELIRQELSRSILLEITDSRSNRRTVEISGKLSLKDLQLMARNESSNTSGKIKFSSYKNISRPVIFALKDLVRQCVIVGRDFTTHFGGYPEDSPRIPQNDRVYVCDLIALEFQTLYNTGRLVFIGKDLPKGLLDEFIYEQVVGEKRPTLEEVAKDKSGRFLLQDGEYFDRKAYKRFVAKDVLTTGLALDQCANEFVNFKFLKYGTGYYAGPYQKLLESLIGQGVAEGLAELLPRQRCIKAVELPFYSQEPLIDKVCAQNKVQLKYSKDDALERTFADYATATTNCACAHASTGNTMNFSSVDGAIARNLRGKANKFSPLINREMREIFLK